MRSICLVVALFVGAVMFTMSGGCGSGSDGPAPTCGNTLTCTQGDPVCSQSCGAGRIRLCQCGQGVNSGTLVCDPCMRVQGTGGAGMTGTGGITGTAGRAGRGTGGAAVGGRTGRGTGGAAAGGRTGRGTGGAATSSGGSVVVGTGGFTPSDAGTPTCSAGVEAGGVACTPTATPICQTACVGGLYNICTCVSGTFVCPSNQIACP